MDEPAIAVASGLAAPLGAGVPRSEAHRRNGLLYGLCAYLAWGFFPLYFKALVRVSPLEVLAHRVVWAALFLGILIALTGQRRAVVAAVRRPRTLILLACSTVLIAGNWFVYIWSVNTGRVLESSLGYFINPLVNVLLGVVFLGERLRRWQVISVAMAGVAVAYLTYAAGTVPWIALTLACTFGVYGLLRKIAHVDAMVGLTIETTLLAPLGISALVWWGVQGTLGFGGLSRTIDALLLLGGVITAVPLVWFATAARRLPLTTMGFLQYLAPSIQFGMAVLVFKEPLDRARLAAFAVIWAALLVYSVGAWRSGRAEVEPD